LALRHLLDREIHYGGVLLQEERVLREALDVQNNELWQAGDLESLHKVVLVGLVLLLGAAIKLAQQLVEIHLRYDILAEFVGEQRWRRQIASEVDEIGVLHLVLVLLGSQELRLCRIVQLYWWYFARIDLHLSQKDLVKYGGVGLFVALECAVQGIEEPRQEVDGIALLGDLKPFTGPQHYGLKHLVWRHMCLKVAWIPHLAH